MKHFLRCNAEDGQAIELAIETVGRANDDALTAQLVEFLMGDIDGTPKVGISAQLAKRQRSSFLESR